MPSVIFQTRAMVKVDCISLSVHVTSELREKSFNRVFLQDLSRKHGFLGKIFVSRFVFLYLTPGCQLFQPSRCETAFAKQRPDFSDF